MGPVRYWDMLGYGGRSAPDCGFLERTESKDICVCLISFFVLYRWGAFLFPFKWCHDCKLWKCICGLQWWKTCQIWSGAELYPPRWPHLLPQSGVYQRLPPEFGSKEDWMAGLQPWAQPHWTLVGSAWTCCSCQSDQHNCTGWYSHSHLCCSTHKGIFLTNVEINRLFCVLLITLCLVDNLIVVTMV